MNKQSVRKSLRKIKKLLRLKKLELLLTLKNMTLKEIAVATDKSLSNVGTVRGNIRKKLGLAPEDDLREWLLAAIKRNSRS